MKFPLAYAMLCFVLYNGDEDGLMFRLIPPNELNLNVHKNGTLKYITASKKEDGDFAFNVLLIL